MKLTRMLVGIIFFVLIDKTVQADLVPVPETYGLTLAWNPSPSPEIVGCHLYYGTASGQYTNTVVVGNVTNVTISGLSAGVTYYFAITAVDASGQESDFSNEISYQKEPTQQALPAARLKILNVSDGQVVLNVTGPASHAYYIEATEDFTTWTVIGTVTVDASGSNEFVDAGAADHSQRFYRAQENPPSALTIPAAQMRMHRLPDGQQVLTVTGLPGRTYTIEATGDFMTWTDIGTVTLNASGTLDITDTDAANFPQRFYRTRDDQL